MSYLRVLLTRWSRRDRLAVVVVASITALLVGTALVLAAVGTATTGVAGAAALESNGTATVVHGQGVDGAPADGALTLPIAHATVGGEPATIVGVPADAPRNGPLSVPAPPDTGTVRGPGSATDPVSLEGANGTATVDVVDRRSDGPLPPWWYVASERTVEEIGHSATLVVAANDSAAGTSADGGRSVPLVGTLEFFLRGTAQLLGAVGTIAVGVGVLVAVVVYSVTRMAIRDRLATIAVLRATGASGRRVLCLFAGRAALLTTVGVVAGGAAGVVLTNAAVNVAVTVGVPTTVSVRLTPRVAWTLAPALFGLVITGLLAGVAATLPTVRESPATLHRRAAGTPAAPGRGADGTDATGDGARALGDGFTPLRMAGRQVRRLRGRSEPVTLESRAVLGTAATMTVFVAAVLVATTAAGAIAPLSGGDGTAVLQGGAAHPWSSSVDADYATSLRSDGRSASPEILAFSVVDGEPFLTRGAEYGAFAELSDATLVAGEPPDGPGEAVVGRDLARSLSADVGDRLPLGGTNRPAVAEVEVTGIYRAPGFADDQLVVPLATARHLTNAGAGEVNLIRVDGPLGDDASGGDRRNGTAGNALRVVDIAAPDAVGSDETVPVTVTVENRGDRRTDEDLRVALDGETRTESVTLDPGERTSVAVAFGPQQPGTSTVAVGDRSVEVVVQAADTLALGQLPESAPPGADLTVRVVNGTGEPVANATVGLDGAEDRSRTDADGLAAVTLPESGTATVVASAPGNGSATHPVTVDAGADRAPMASLSVSPSRSDVLQRPTARLVLANSWNDTRTWSVDASGSVAGSARSVRLDPGDRRTVEVDLSRAGTGTHEVVATANGTTVARTEYTVEGDDRVASALATGDRLDATDSGLGQAAAHALGNLRVLLGTLVGLAAAATVAATAAAFARTVHASRRTIAIHRATGATPRQVLTRVLADATRVAVPATILSVVAGYLLVRGLAAAGLLTAFGVALVPSPSVATLAAVAVLALSLALLAAAIAAVGMIRVSPGRLFAGRAGDAGTSRKGGEDP